MSIHKTESGTFEVKWRENGKQRSQTFKRKVDANSFDALKKLGIDTEEALGRIGLGPVIEKALCKDEMTFAQLSNIWLVDHAEVHKSPSSVIRDRQMLKDFLLPTFGLTKLSQIQKHDVVRLQASLHAEGRLKPKSINNVIGLLHKIFDDGVGWGHIKHNPVEYVKNIRLNETEYRFWNFSQKDKFLAHIKKTDLETFRVVCFTVNTGLRKGEVDGLLRDCLDFDRREITVKRSFCDKTKELNEYTKGKNIRRVPMNDDVLEVLEFCRHYRPSQKVFNLDFHNFSDVFYPSQKRAGVPRISFHDLRHTFASLLAMSGVSVFLIQKLLGHSDLKTTMRYMHMAPDHLKGVTDVLRQVVDEKKLPDSKTDFDMPALKKVALGQ